MLAVDWRWRLEAGEDAGAPRGGLSRLEYRENPPGVRQYHLSTAELAFCSVQGSTLSERPAMPLPAEFPPDSRIFAEP